MSDVKIAIRDKGIKFLVCECGNNIFFVCLDGDVLCTNCRLVQDLEVKHWERQLKNT